MKPIIDLIWNPEELPIEVTAGDMHKSCIAANCTNPGTGGGTVYPSWSGPNGGFNAALGGCAC